MNLFEEAVIYSTVMHTGAIRKNTTIPYIMHPLEVAQIIATMTEDVEVITAGVLHDVVEDTDGTLKEIRARFGERVASLVEAETENKYEGEDKAATWKKRKEETLIKLKNTTDIGIEMLYLGDKLSNIRTLARMYSEQGNEIWKYFNQQDPQMHRWYYKTVAEYLELDLNKTGAFKELVQHINYIWPGTFASEKTRFKKYKELSIDGCKMIGQGAKGKVYRYNDELIVKVYNENNTFKEIERENYLAKKAFLAGIPTAISFGIVAVGNKYGSVFELLNSSTVSQLISSDSQNVKAYGEIMARLALTIHNTDATEIDLPEYMPDVYDWIDGGIAYADPELAVKIRKMVDEIPPVTTMIHGDFHGGNVMVQKDEYLLIDMDRLSICNPIVELSGVYLFYIGFGEWNRSVLENFMGFSCETARAFYQAFMEYYVGTDDKEELQSVIDKAALLCYVRLVKRCYKKGINLSEDDAKACAFYMDKIRGLLERVDSLAFTVRPYSED